MKKVYFLLAALFALAVHANAQNTGNIKGVLMDTAAKQPVADATITVLQASDSSLITFSRTNKNGAFDVRYIPKGKYRMLVSHVGFRNYSKNFDITDDQKEVDLGYIAMTSKSHMLDEVTVTQERAPVALKGDTVEYNAGSFKTKPNAVVEDLLKKLPGVQVDKDGKIKANGEEVKKVLVDGKEFFGNDPKVATKNLPADIVDKVQVFDKKSDQSQFTGFDDGNSEKTINLTVKPDKKHGMFGRATVAAGNKERYQGNINLNQFKGDRQMSLIGMANNTNKQGFSFMDLLNFQGGLGGPGGGRGGGSIEISSGGGGLPIQGMGGQPTSITTTWAGGLNFNDKWGENLNVNGSYFYNRIDDRSEQKTNRQYISPTNPFNYAKDALVSRRSENHRLNVIADQRIDSNNSIKFTSTANIQNSLGASASNYSSQSLKGNMLNRGFSENRSNSNGYSWNNSVLWRHKFAKKGRTFSANLTFGLNAAESNGTLNTVNDFFRPDGTIALSDTLDQQNMQNTDAMNYGAVLAYTEPLSKRSLLEFNFNYNNSNNKSARETFDVDKNTGKHTIRNEFLSNDFDNTYTYNRGGVNWRYQQKNFNFSIGTSVQQASLESDFHFLGKDSIISQSFVNVLPNAQMQYSINKYKNLRFSYFTSTRQPSATQLNPIIDNTDRLNIRQGNPGLDQEYTHRMQLGYMAFDPFRRTSFFSMLSFMGTSNRIVNYDEIDAQGIRYTTFRNVNGVYNLNATVNFGLPVRSIKSNLNGNTNISQSRNVNFVDGSRNVIHNMSLAQELSLNFVHKEALDITLGTMVSYNRVRYSITNEGNTNYWNQEYSLDANIYLPHGFSIASEFSFIRNTGYATGFNTNVPLWNAGIAKQLFKNKKGEIRLQVFDLLNENIGISRNANQNYIEDVSSRVLNRYFLLSFTYNISRFAGKSVPVQRQADVKVIGGRL
ncbi:MAG TPA: outer membrane beta-barrel family protein [Chitinophagaceae bacterium]|nr:outer membrane beta-barrel family protein [Chitinophagaceae bacterium]